MKKHHEIIVTSVLLLAAACSDEGDAPAMGDVPEDSGAPLGDADSADPDSGSAAVDAGALPVADDSGTVPVPGDSGTGPGPDDAGAGGHGDFACTRVIGFSQTNQWFAGTGSEFESLVADDRWELLWQGGAGVELWADPSFDGWDNRIVSPCAGSRGGPDRVLLTISGGSGENVDRWEMHIRDAIATIRGKYPTVEQIVLQPVVGGHMHEICPLPGGGTVRATVQHPVIDMAIARIVGGDVVAGMSPEVSSCADYQPDIGHFVSAAIPPISRAIGTFYVPF